MRYWRYVHLVGTALLFVGAGMGTAAAIYMAQTHRPALLVWMMSGNTLILMAYGASYYWMFFLRRGSPFGPSASSKPA